jgi:Pyruvate/2-oxoacid:ferredoxin oxidoreductase gamma subunit
MDPQIRAYLKEKGIEAFIFNAEKLAREAGSIQSTNIAMIGFAAAHPRFPFSHDKLKEVIERVTSTKFREVSLRIFEKAFSEGRKSIKPQQ